MAGKQALLEIVERFGEHPVLLAAMNAAAAAIVTEEGFPQHLGALLKVFIEMHAQYMQKDIPSRN